MRTSTSFFIRPTQPARLNRPSGFYSKEADRAVRSPASAATHASQVSKGGVGGVDNMRQEWRRLTEPGEFSAGLRMFDEFMPGMAVGNAGSSAVDGGGTTVGLRKIKNNELAEIIRSCFNEDGSVDLEKALQILQKQGTRTHISRLKVRLNGNRSEDALSKIWIPKGKLENALDALRAEERPDRRGDSWSKYRLPKITRETAERHIRRLASALNISPEHIRWRIETATPEGLINSYRLALQELPANDISRVNARVIHHVFKEHGFVPKTAMAALTARYPGLTEADIINRILRSDKLKFLRGLVGAVPQAPKILTNAGAIKGTRHTLGALNDWIAFQLGREAEGIELLDRVYGAIPYPDVLAVGERIADKLEALHAALYEDTAALNRHILWSDLVALRSTLASSEDTGDGEEEKPLGELKSPIMKQIEGVNPRLAARLARLNPSERELNYEIFKLWAVVLTQEDWEKNIKRWDPDNAPSAAVFYCYVAKPLLRMSSKDRADVMSFMF